MSFEGHPRNEGLRSPAPYLMTLTGIQVSFGYDTPNRTVLETYDVGVSFAPNDVMGTLRVLDVFDSTGKWVNPEVGWSAKFKAAICHVIYEALQEACDCF